jgi:hypothetical protein
MSSILSGSLLATSMLIGQAAEPPTKSVAPVQQVQSVQTQPMQAGPQKGPIVSFFTREDRPILHRIQGWFKRDQSERKEVQGGITGKEPPVIGPPTIVPSSSSGGGSNDFPRKMPSPSSQMPTTGKDITQTSLKQPTQASKSPILPQWEMKIGRDEKFEWITGQFEIENGSPVLYYATPETIDKYNGRIVLQPQQTDLAKFRRGDLVSVRGQIAQSKLMQGSTPIYRVTSASLVDRPKS